MELTYQACTRASNFNLSGPIDLTGLLILKTLPRPDLIDIILTGGKKPMENDGLRIAKSPSPVHTQHQYCIYFAQGIISAELVTENHCHMNIPF